MKMLYILNTTNKVNNFSYSSMIAVQRLGIEFHIAGNWTGYNNPADKRTDEKNYGIRIHQVDFIRTPYDPRNIRAYRQVIEIIKREKIDIIHCNTPIGGLIGRLAGKRCRVKKIIYEAHGFHFFKGAPMINWLLYFPIEWVLSFFTDILITINKEDFTRAKKYMKAKKVENVPGVGIDLSKFTVSLSDEQKHKKKMEIGIPSDAKVILSVGELNENKNHEIVIRALAKLKNNKLHYVIAGMGNLKNHLQKLSKELDIENNIHLIGFRNDIVELYKISDIFVHPSFREGLPVALMEAMASGLPCVVSRIRGNVDLIRNKKMLCNPNSIDDFARAIYELESSKFERKETGKQNRVNIHCCSVEKVVALITSIYEAALK